MLTSLGFSREWYLIPLAAIVGVLGGLVATGFHWLVEFSAELFFGEFFFGHASARPLPIPTWALLILLPATGGLMVGLIQRYISRTGPTHGIPEVIEALAKKHGKMPPRMGLFKTITASLTIGSGGSGGVEGPIIQTGSVLGSVTGQILHVPREHMHTLVGCGAAAGMAGIFNAPIAGVLFVLEVLLRDFSLKTFIPIVIASVFGTTTAQALAGGNVAVFQEVGQELHAYQVQFGELWAYGLLGLLCGLTGVAFMWTEYYSERAWHRLKVPQFVKPALGGVVLGLMGIVFLLWFGNPVRGYNPPAFFSNGYPVTEALIVPWTYPVEADAQLEVADPPAEPVAEAIAEAGPEPQAAPAEDALTPHAEPGELTPPANGIAPAQERPPRPGLEVTIALLLAMVAFKLVGTCVTMGSGGSGGFIAPSLFIGAALGGGFGMVLDAIGLFPGFNPATYALAGMAGVIAATVHAPLTAFLLVFEMTQDYKIILPVMLVSILAAAFAQFIYSDSIYTSWLRRHGIRMGSYADMRLLRRLEVSHVPLAPPVMVHPEDPAQRLIELAEHYAASDYVVCNGEDTYVGMIVGEDMRTTLIQREAIPLMIVGELMRTNLPTVTREETLDVVLDKFSRYDVASLPVVDEDEHVRGVITRSRLMRQYQRALEEA
ncbi:MAG: chloride channel protein [Phycisphaeraceae bacterium]